MTYWWAVLWIVAFVGGAVAVAFTVKDWLDHRRYLGLISKVGVCSWLGCTRPRATDDPWRDYCDRHTGLEAPDGR